MTDGDDAKVIEMSASADGSVHVALEIPTGEDAPDEEPPEFGNDEPGPDVVAGAAKVTKTVLGTIWDVINPRDD